MTAESTKPQFGSRLVEAVAPGRLGVDYKRLLGSSWVSNIGDGAAIAAGPLLVASQTHSPFLVASAALLQRLPWLILGLHAGVLADRVDRRRLVAIADGSRAVVVGVLALAVSTGWVDIGVVLAAMFLMGTAEVFANTTSSTLLPMIVESEELGTANAGIQTSLAVGYQLVGPPLGAAMFTMGMAVPFAMQAVCVAVGARLVLQMSVRRDVVERPTSKRPRHEIAEGIRWLLHNAPMRTLAIVIFTFNVTWGAAWSVLVLWSEQRLHAGEIGFGLLTTAAAVGGLCATASFRWLQRNVSYERLMKVCLTLEVLLHLCLALTTATWLALVLMWGFGCYAFVWGAVNQTIRQRAVPEEFQGRVSSVYLMGVFGGLVFGQGIGGLIADQWGVVAPFWFAFIGSGLTLAVLWRQLGRVVPSSEPAGG